MHAKNREENIYATLYMQAKFVVAIDPNVLLCFPNLPLSFGSKTPSMPHSPRALQENSRCPRVWERERIMRELKNWTDQTLCIDPHKSFYELGLYFLHSVIFLHFPPHMQPMTFRLPLLLISISFINKWAKIPFFLSKSLAISFINFLSHQ